MEKNKIIQQSIHLLFLIKMIFYKLLPLYALFNYFLPQYFAKGAIGFACSTNQICQKLGITTLYYKRNLPAQYWLTFCSRTTSKRHRRIH